MEKIYLNRSPDFHEKVDLFLSGFAKTVFSKNFAHEFAKDIYKKNYTVPSPYSDGKAAIIAGSYVESARDGVFGNFLLFQDESSRKKFILMQRMRFISCIILLDENTVIFPSPSDDDERTLEISENLSENLPQTPHECVFSGIIFGGHGRPYHQIYDQLPLFYEFSNITRNKLLIHRTRSFFSAADFGFNASNWMPPKGTPEWGGRFYLLASRIFDAKKKQSLIEAADLVRARNSRLRFSDELAGFRAWRRSYDPVIWMGVCDLKPRWTSSIDAVKLSISRIRKEFPRAGFVFDGMTAPASADTHRFRDKYCLKEQEKLANIIEEMDLQSSHFNVMGCAASVKIHAAGHCDYFVSNAGTDAVWMALFHRKPGLVHCANKGRSTVNRNYIHPKSTFIPEHKVQDIDDGKVWHWMDYNIDPAYFADMAVSGLKKALKISDGTKLIQRGEADGFSTYGIFREENSLELYIPPGKYTSKIDIYPNNDETTDLSLIVRQDDEAFLVNPDRNGEFLFDLDRESRIFFDVKIRSDCDFEFHGFSLARVDDIVTPLA